MEVLRSSGSLGAAKKLQFETSSPLKPREIHDLRRLLWTGLGRDGGEVALSAIQVWWDAEGCIVSLRFVHGACAETTVGICAGGRVAVELGVGEVVVAMDVGITSGPLGDVLVVCIAFLFRADTRKRGLLSPFSLDFPLHPKFFGRAS
ncbi:hypothetical protein IMZ48_18300 [Candidatus Bathyarchaeota archaeon]|nr:hypothetical protein [Candidatus Bathyarchaeota archaeon]